MIELLAMTGVAALLVRLAAGLVARFELRHAADFDDLDRERLPL